MNEFTAASTAYATTPPALRPALRVLEPTLTHVWLEQRTKVKAQQAAAAHYASGHTHTRHMRRCAACRPAATTDGTHAKQQRWTLWLPATTKTSRLDAEAERTRSFTAFSPESAASVAEATPTDVRHAHHSGLLGCAPPMRACGHQHSVRALYFCTNLPDGTSAYFTVLSAIGGWGPSVGARVFPRRRLQPVPAPIVLLATGAQARARARARRGGATRGVSVAHGCPTPAARAAALRAARVLRRPRLPGTGCKARGARAAAASESAGVQNAAAHACPPAPALGRRTRHGARMVVDSSER
jgi:hypothetical protein